GVGEEGAGGAVAVAPECGVGGYVERAGPDEARIAAVLEPHPPAAPVPGQGPFALEHGTPVHLNPLADPEYSYEPLADGDEVSVGDVTLRAVHTPGHRPEHTCFAVIDRSRGDEPWLLLTGDSLFVGDAARPALPVAPPPRPPVRGARGRARSLPQPASAPRPRRRRGGLPGPRLRVALRHGDELQGVDDDRLRAPLQPGAAHRPRGRLRGRLRVDRRAEAPERRADRRAEPRAVPRRAGAGAAARSPGRRGRARRPPARGLPRRARARRHQRARGRLELLDEGRLHAPARRG